MKTTGIVGEGLGEGKQWFQKFLTIRARQKTNKDVLEVLLSSLENNSLTLTQTLSHND